MSETQVNAALLGEKDSAYQPTAFDQPWALSRLLQHRSFYEVIETVPFAVLHKHWKTVKPTLMSKSLQAAYEYYINKVISAAK